MTQEIAGSMMLALMALALALALWGWKRRQRSYAGLVPHLVREMPQSAPTFEVPALYVATTATDNPLERVAAGPLSYRSRATLRVHPEGLSVTMPGQAPFLMPASPSLEAGLATWTIDRVVEPEGLVMVRWGLGPGLVDSYFRIIDGDPTAFVEAVGALRKGTV